MRRLVAFESISTDGYFADKNGEIGWLHERKRDPEFDRFTAENARGNGTLLLGRRTYEIMVAYWPTEQAKRDMPEVAEGMNRLPKVVFSRTLDPKKVTWQNTRLVREGLVAEVRKLKGEDGEAMVILGSGTLVSQLTQERLIDEYQLVVTPTILGDGKSPFTGVKRKLDLKLVRTRPFGNGNVVLTYEPTT